MAIVKRWVETPITFAVGGQFFLIAKSAPTRSYLQFWMASGNPQLFITTTPNNTTANAPLAFTGGTNQVGQITYDDKDNPLTRCEWYGAAVMGFFPGVFVITLEVLDDEIPDPPVSRIIMGDRTPISRQIQAVQPSPLSVETVKMYDALRGWKNGRR